LAVFTKRPFKLDAGIVELDNWIILELQNKVNMYNKSDFATELKNRTKKFAIESIRHFRKLPKTDEARIIGKQFLRSSTSVAANYRAVCRARSEAEFYSKLCIVVEEIDETVLWLEIMDESDISKPETLYEEAVELMKIMSVSKSKVATKIKK
jgi:four helix bundle protein